MWNATDAASDVAFYRPQERGEQLREFLDTLIRGRWLILGAVVIATVGAIIYSLSLPNRYQASSILRVEQKGGTSLAEMFSSGFPGRSGYSPRFLNNEMLVLRQSLPIAERAAERMLEIEADPTNTVELRIVRNQETGVLHSPQFLAFRLQRAVSISPADRDVDAIRISARSTIPAEAALIANVYAQEYIRRTQETSRASVSASREFLQTQVDKWADELSSRENDLQVFMSRENAIALNEESSFLVQQLSQLEARRDEAEIEAQLTRATLDARNAELEAIRPSLAERLASGVDQEIQAALERKVQLEEQVEAIYLRNPALRTDDVVPENVGELRRQIAALQGRIRTLSDQYVQEMLAVGGMDPSQEGLTQVAQLQRTIIEGRITLSGLDARIGSLRDRITEYEQQLSQVPAQAIELAQLQRGRQSAEQTYLMLVNKLQELRVAEESELGYAELIRRALAPSFPYTPNRKMNVILAFLLGLGLGIGAAIARKQLDSRIHRPDDLRDMGETVIGIIPDMTELVKKEYGGQDTITQDGYTFDTRLVSLLNPLATVSEAYRGLRTNIQFSRPDVVVQTILVTSSNPTEGKSVTAANLAIVMAQAGRRVLLVDADLRRPTVHKKLGLNREPGLRDLLFAPDRFDATEFETVVENLYVVPAGGSTPNPSELLGSKRMREVLDMLKEEFDLVIFDAPPVTAATDAVLLSTQCDAVLAVVAANETRRHEVEHALGALRSVGGEVIGVLLNGFDASKAYGYSYKYRYGYSSYYGYSYRPEGVENA
ncbi:MAG: polysaccharide biosynthesis tyrosine autokinase [Bacteroidota bacterium]